jgi:hypothetical protein
MAFINEGGEKGYTTYSCGHILQDSMDGYQHGTSLLCPECRAKQSKKMELRTPIIWHGFTWWLPQTRKE